MGAAAGLVDHLVSVVGDEPVAAGLAELIERAALATLHQQGVAQATEVTIALVSPEEIRELNCTYRQVDEETDVLSFGMDDDQEPTSLPDALPYLGDIAISFPRAEAQALEYGHSIKRECAYLTVHGVLHLLGHDHHDPDDQRQMRAAEEAVLALLGLSRRDE
jgi:probable rRNA maturation factor